MNWEVKAFNQLNTTELYQIMALRQEVFVVEQNCPYLDADGKDFKSYHVMGFYNDELAAYARVIQPGISYTEAAVGRVIVKMDFRNKKLGYELMQKCHEFIEYRWGNKNPKNNQQLISIRISAQSHLENFYRNCGYAPTGKAYLEDGIPHIEMVRE